MKNTYMILQYPADDNFNETVSQMKEIGISPSPMDNIGIAYQHIFWQLNSFDEFFNAHPRYKGKNILAINCSNSELPSKGRIFPATDKGLKKILYQGLEKTDNLDVRNCEVHDLSKF